MYENLKIDDRKEVINSLLETAKLLIILDKDLVHADKNESWKLIEKIQTDLRTDDEKIDETFRKDLEKFIANYQFEINK